MIRMYYSISLIVIQETGIKAHANYIYCIFYNINAAILRIQFLWELKTLILLKHEDLKQKYINLLVNWPTDSPSKWNYTFQYRVRQIGGIIKFIYNPMSRDTKPQDRTKSTQKIIKHKADFTYLTPFNYRILKQIGRGGYGVVYKACEISNPENLSAIKINFNTVSRQLIYAEMAFLMLVNNNERLPKLLNLFVYKDFTHIVIEYFKFKPFITFFNTFPVIEVKHYIYELLLGLKGLKDLGIYHRDIKPGNFLYNPEKRRGLIIDFGLAEIDPIYKQKLQKKVQKMAAEKDPKHQQQLNRLKIYRRLSDCLKIIGRNKIGTETYMPLESILHHSQQTYQSDIWPVGVIMLQFAARKYNIFNSVKILNKPQGIKNTYYINYLIQLATFFGSEQVVSECKKLNYDLRLPADIDRLNFKQIKIMMYSEEYDDDMDDLLQKMMCLDAKTRITVQGALEHRFFDDVRGEH